MSQDMDLLDEDGFVESKLESGMLSVIKDPPEDENQTGADITPWNSRTSGTNSNTEMSTPVFEVKQTRIVNEIGKKKHVMYTIRLITNCQDLNPPLFERRYSDFLHLYRLLKKQYPQHTASIKFPKKVLIGNFAPGVIETRSWSFEQFLKTIVENEQLKNSVCLNKFLCGPELKEAKNFLKTKDYDNAKPLLENSFRLLNKIYTDRHPCVIIVLCKLVACCNANCYDLVSAEKYAELALHRYEAISDVDLLQFYVPLLQLCVHLWWKLGRDKKYLDKRLDDLKRCGHRVDDCLSLLDTVLQAD